MVDDLATHTQPDRRNKASPFEGKRERVRVITGFANGTSSRSSYQSLEREKLSRHDLDHASCLHSLRPSIASITTLSLPASASISSQSVTQSEIMAAFYSSKGQSALAQAKAAAIDCVTRSPTKHRGYECLVLLLDFDEKSRTSGTWFRCRDLLISPSTSSPALLSPSLASPPASPLASGF